MNFWQSEIGSVTGDADDAFIKDFTVIPDGTMALGKIMSFHKAEDKMKNAVYEIVWLLTDGDFKNRQVTQKIKAFDTDPKVRHRALNMLKLIYLMYKVKPGHTNEPSDIELKAFVNKFAGLRIREWSIEKQDGSGIMEGNFIAEVHPSQGFKCETGVKTVVTHTNNLTPFGHNQEPLDSAFNRQKSYNPSSGDTMGMVEDDLPF